MDSVNRIGIICDYWFLFWDFCPVLHTNKPLSSSLEQYHRPEKQDSSSRVKVRSPDWWLHSYAKQLPIELSVPHGARHINLCSPVRLPFKPFVCVIFLFGWLRFCFVGFWLVLYFVCCCLFVCLFVFSISSLI